MAAAVALSSCGGQTAPTSSGSRSVGGAHGVFLVVAAENFWGSIARQLAGTKADVRSLIVNPGTDPHSYLPTSSDSRVLAQSRMAIINGIAYDNWARQALDASPDSGRTVLDTGKLLGLAGGANPHQWYAPTNVRRVVDGIVADYIKLDPADRTYFVQRQQGYLTRGLARYNLLRADIARRFRGVPIGYSESIFEPLGLDLGLKLATPSSFARAIADGTDVTAQDKQTVDAQAQTGAIKVWIYNSQNLTPDVQRVNSLVEARHIPVVKITETLAPADATFQDWQVAQLTALEAALHQATGR